ncbi:MAG TPA: YncE family protein [Bacteroidota bacterium]|nr:YncE family protein [Bacteroidota bacterium]
MNRSTVFFSILMILAALGGCKKDGNIVDSGIDVTKAQVVYVVNEGNFTKANSSLTMYVPDSLKTYQDVFAAANNRNLGDVANDMVVWGSNGYIVVNNSQKIEVVSLDNMKSLGTITIPGSKSPYKVAVFSQTKGYVTNLNDGSVTAFNPTTFTIVKERIPVGENPQGIIAYNGKVYVCNRGSEYGAGVDSTIAVIDPSTDTVVKTIVVGLAPNEIGVDSQGKLIVKCEGYSVYGKPQNDLAGSIVKIDPTTNTVTGTLLLPLAMYEHPTKMTVTATGFAFVKVKNAIMKMSTGSMTVVNPVFIPVSSYSINGLAFDNSKNRLYVADAVDYVSAGTVTIYDGNGSVTGTFKTGITPGTIAMRSTSVN